MVFTVIGCSKFGGDVELVKTGYLDYDKSISVGQAFDGYKYFSSKNWKTLKTEQGRRVVEFNGIMDMNNPDIKERIDLGIKQFNKKRFTGLRTVVQFVVNGDNTYKISALSLVGTLEDGKTEKEANWMTPEYVIKQIYSNEAYGATALVEFL